MLVCVFHSTTSYNRFYWFVGFFSPNLSIFVLSIPCSTPNAAKNWLCMNWDCCYYAARLAGNPSEKSCKKTFCYDIFLKTPVTANIHIFLIFSISFSLDLFPLVDFGLTTDLTLSHRPTSYLCQHCRHYHVH